MIATRKLRPFLSVFSEIVYLLHAFRIHSLQPLFHSPKLHLELLSTGSWYYDTVVFPCSSRNRREPQKGFPNISMWNFPSVNYLPFSRLSTPLLRRLLTPLQNISAGTDTGIRSEVPLL